jgi:hypothetical protein
VSKKKSSRPRRVDYWHDPAAPKPTSRKPSASVIVRNSAGDPPVRLDDYDIHPAIRRRIVHGLDPTATPHVD